MRSTRNYKFGELNTPQKIDTLRLVAVACSIGLLGVFSLTQQDSALTPSPSRNDNPVNMAKKLRTNEYSATSRPLISQNSVEQKSNASSFTHRNIKTTVFWAGEDADSSNGYIANSASAWDENWATHYGGVDNPSGRNGYNPGAFTPKENPFYVALPYNDFDASDNRRPDAKNCHNAGLPGLENYSWCKGTWLAIRNGDKTTYAQWQDVGPYHEDDSAYVFGNAAPKNTAGVGAGLDVSPAVRDYLKIGDVSNCDWTFVTTDQVPDGPWKQTTATNKGTFYQR